MISGNMVGSYSQIGKTFVIQDEDGNELMAVVTDQEQIFTAGDNDVREGLVYASDSGVSTGTKVIPSYFTREGNRVILNNSQFIIPIVEYDYTKLQVIICPFNTTINDSVAAEKVVINDSVYSVLSTEVVSTVTKEPNGSSGVINLGITNQTGKPCLLRYFTYKEIY